MNELSGLLEVHDERETDHVRRLNGQIPDAHILVDDRMRVDVVVRATALCSVQDVGDA
jgi:quinolinate synthase